MLVTGIFETIGGARDAKLTDPFDRTLVGSGIAVFFGKSLQRNRPARMRCTTR